MLGVRCKKPEQVRDYDTPSTRPFTAENNLTGRGAQGYFYAEPVDTPSPIVAGDLQPFALDRAETRTLTGTAHISPAAAGRYGLDVVANDTLTFITQSDPDLAIYFETNVDRQRL